MSYFQSIQDVNLFRGQFRPLKNAPSFEDNPPKDKKNRAG